MFRARSCSAILWSQGTIVEFNNGLRVAAAKLREALRDRPTEPRFIRTISGHGYQFIGDATPLDEPAELIVSVDMVAEDLAQIADSSPIEASFQAIAAEKLPPAGALDVADSALMITIPALAQTAPESEPAIAQARPWFQRSLLRRPRLLALAACLAALLFFLGWLAYERFYLPRMLSGGRIVLGNIANRTNDQIFDRTLSLALRSELEESPYLSLTADPRPFRTINACSRSGSPRGADCLFRSRRAGSHRWRNLRTRIRLSAAPLCAPVSRRAFADSQEIDADSRDSVLPALHTLTEHMRRAAWRIG